MVFVVLLMLTIITPAWTDLAASAYFDQRHTTVLAAFAVDCPSIIPLNTCPQAMFWILEPDATPTAWRVSANGAGPELLQSDFMRVDIAPPLPWKLRILRHRSAAILHVNDIQVAYLRQPPLSPLTDGDRPVNSVFQTGLGDPIPSVVLDVAWDRLDGTPVAVGGQHEWSASLAAAGSLLKHNGAKYLYFPATTPPELQTCSDIHDGAKECVEAIDPTACLMIQCRSQLCSLCGWWARILD